jgi:hypothetical protein
VTISKIRFLERPVVSSIPRHAVRATASFFETDVERLRVILREKREKTSAAEGDPGDRLESGRSGSTTPADHRRPGQTARAPNVEAAGTTPSGGTPAGGRSCPAPAGPRSAEPPPEAPGLCCGRPTSRPWSPFHNRIRLTAEDAVRPPPA